MDLDAFCADIHRRLKKLEDKVFADAGYLPAPAPEKPADDAPAGSVTVETGEEDRKEEQFVEKLDEKVAEEPETLLGGRRRRS